MVKRGKLIVFEGGDGSGKTTQFVLFTKFLKNKGIKYKTYKFPRHQKPFFGVMVDEYLNNNFGPANQVNPKLASLIYALDRWEAATTLQQWLDQGYWVVLDRYVTSNMGHQLGKIKSDKKKEIFLKWLEELEYKILQIPKPDKVLFFNVPLKHSLRLMANRQSKDYIKGKLDGHENQEHLKNTRQAYLFVAQKQSVWEIINCVENNSLLTPDKIHDKVKKIFNYNI